jgi:hypothetical protein
MPSSLVQYQYRMPAWRYGLTDCFQVKCHRLGIGIGQHEANCRIALRAHGAKDIRRLRLLLPHDAGPGSLAGPKASLSATLPNAHFILKPDIDLIKLHTIGKSGFYLPDKFFLNAACLTGSACGLIERADIQAISSRLSKSYTPFNLYATANCSDNSWRISSPRTLPPPRLLCSCSVIHKMYVWYRQSKFTLWRETHYSYPCLLHPPKGWI